MVKGNHEIVRDWSTAYSLNWGMERQGSLHLGYTTIGVGKINGSLFASSTDAILRAFQLRTFVNYDTRRHIRFPEMPELDVDQDKE